MKHLIYLSLFLGSCGIVDSLYSDLDKKPKKYKPKASNKLEFYRRNKNINSLNTKNYYENSLRRSHQQTRSKRVQANDLYDKMSSGSLWSGDGQKNYFFANNTKRNVHDIIKIKVQGKLKDIISERLESYKQKNDEKKSIKQKIVIKQLTKIKMINQKPLNLQRPSRNDLQNIYQKFTTPLHLLSQKK